MNKPSVAIVKSDFHGKHSTSWSRVWIDYCIESGISHCLIDWRALDAFDQMVMHDIVLWHLSHYSADEMRFARNILLALKAAGCRVFPDAADSDHFDDKVAQAYLLKGLGLPCPSNYPLHSRAAVEQWIDEVGRFPVVAKLRTGSGASSVQLLSDVAALRQYAKCMFGRGIASGPSAMFKVKSNVASARSASEFIRRMRRAPEFLFSWRNARRLGREAGYVYLQEFIPGAEHDLKVVVVANKLTFVARRVRSRDFRASGSGDLSYDRSLLSREMIDVAFAAADSMKSDCTGLDMIIDPSSGHPVILEVNFGFSHTAQLGLNGHFDRGGAWHAEPVNAPRALLERLISELAKSARFGTKPGCGGCHRGY